MRTSDVTDLDHGAAGLSTTEDAAAERDNRVRHRPTRAGHVESHFLKANSPDGRRALWIKHTLLVPVGKPEAAVAELWAVAFDEGGARKVAAKQRYPIQQARFEASPFRIAVPGATLTQHGAEGTLRQPGATFEWALTRTLAPFPTSRSFRPFPSALMYSGPFPRSKSLTPGPDLRLHGSFGVNGTHWNVDGWRGAQGHNWGSSHAHAYAWAHSNAWCEDGRGRPRDGVWLEALSGRTRLPGKLITPWLSVAALALDGEVLRFDGVRALATRKRWVDTRSYAFEVSRAGATLYAEFRAETSQLAGLRYEDPDGTSLSCLNAKIALGRLRLTRGRHTLHLHTAQAALELGTRDPTPGIDLLTG